MKERKREAFLDRLRVAATGAVVLLHTVTGIMDTTDMGAMPFKRRFFLIVLDLVCWCVPVFVMISGYLFLNPEREVSFRQMVTKYCRRIVLALFLFGVPYACLEQMAIQRTLRPAMLLKSIFMVMSGQSWSHLWYLYLVLLLYLLTPALKKLLHALPLSAVYALEAVLLLGSSILPFLKKLLGLEGMRVLPDGGIYFFYYICGYLFCRLRAGQSGGQCAKQDGRGQEACGGEQQGQAAVRRTVDSMDGASWLQAGVVLLVAGMALSRVSGSYTVQMAYNYPFTVVLSLLLFAVGEKRQRREDTGQTNTGWWQKAGSLCFAVYLIHPVFLNVYYKLFGISPLDFNVLLSLPLFFMGVLLPSLLAAWLLRRIPFLCKWVL